MSREIQQYSEDQKGLKKTSGVKHPDSILIPTSLMAVMLHTSEKKGQLGFSKKNLGFIVKRTLCFGPALLYSVWLWFCIKTLQVPFVSTVRWNSNA